MIIGIEEIEKVKKVLQYLEVNEPLSVLSACQELNIGARELSLIIENL
jgi:hypothetical protein